MPTHLACVYVKILVIPLLGDILKENKAAMNKSGQSILKFETVEVEKRSLSVYDSLIER
jgi:hypothetical protein